MFCDWASREIETNASLRSRTEKWEVPEGIVERSVEPSSLDHSIVQPLPLFLFKILLPAERPQSYSGDYALSCAPYPACHHLQLVPVSKDEVAGMLLPAPL